MAKHGSHDFTASNLAAARIIVRHPERYSGLPLEWARRVMTNERQIETSPNLLREEKLHASFFRAEEKPALTANGDKPLPNPLQGVAQLRRGWR